MKQIQINNFKEKVYYEKLDNNMQIFLVPMENKKTFSASIYVDYGSYDISFKKDNKIYNTPEGIAHFLEHKLFEREDNPFTFYAKSGTDVNAYTTQDATSYYFFGNNEFYDNLKYLLNWIKTINIDEKSVEKEKGIILEEARMYLDKPDRVLVEKINENTFSSHPYKNKVIGTLDSIKNITKEDIILCYNSFYRPDNLFLVVSGSFDETKAIEIIKEELKDYKNPNEKIEKIEYEEKDEVSKEYEELYMTTSIPKLAISYKINKEVFKDLKLDKYYLDYYMYMYNSLSLSKTSEVMEELFNESLYSYTNSYIYDTDKHYIITFLADTNKPKELAEKILEITKNPKLLEEDFKRKIKTWIASEIKISDDPRALSDSISSDILEYKEFKNNKIEDLKSLKFATLLQIKQKLNFENKAVVIIYPKK